MISAHFIPGNTSDTKATNLFISEKVSLDIVLIRIALIKSSDSVSLETTFEIFLSS